MNFARRGLFERTNHDQSLTSDLRNTRQDVDRGLQLTSEGGQNECKFAFPLGVRAKMKNEVRTDLLISISVSFRTQ